MTQTDDYLVHCTIMDDLRRGLARAIRWAVVGGAILALSDLVPGRWSMAVQFIGVLIGLGPAVLAMYRWLMTVDDLMPGRAAVKFWIMVHGSIVIVVLTTGAATSLLLNLLT